jgi:DNA-binding LacI/PurR family transcriptional regulator
VKGQVRPRQADVAALARVSPAIVSLVVNDRLDGNVRISAETRSRVWDAVRELGYVPNPVARRLAGGRNRLLGVFTYEPVFPVHASNFYHPFLVGIEEGAEAEGYDLLLFTRATEADGRRSIYKDGVNRLQLADGAVLLGGNERREELGRLVRDGFPFVFVGRREVPEGEIPYVAADYVEATVAVVGHMVAAGHRRIAYLRRPNDPEPSQDREAGFRLAHQRFGLSLGTGAIRRCEAEDITPDLLHGYADAGVTALIAESPEVARMVLEVARGSGRRIPEDCSLAALGDRLLAREPLPAVTTFAIPHREMGAEAVRLLVRILSDDDRAAPRRVVLPCTLVPGATVAPPVRS